MTNWYSETNHNRTVYPEWMFAVDSPDRLERLIRYNAPRTIATPLSSVICHLSCTIRREPNSARFVVRFQAA